MNNAGLLNPTTAHQHYKIKQFRCVILDARVQDQIIYIPDANGAEGSVFFEYSFAGGVRLSTSIDAKSIYQHHQ